MFRCFASLRIETSNSMPSLRSASNIEFRIRCGI
nr:MAG TPA: hypothetical protein [Caudoviricetes sp.]